jgi:phenylacetate-CoA ligase
MAAINIRKPAYLALLRLRGQPVGPFYRRILRETLEGIPAGTIDALLTDMLDHCARAVPYYTEVMERAGYRPSEDPRSLLRRLPILTKDIIRSRFEDLRFRDIGRRNWFYNTSGGSTGEPVRFIQDMEFAVKSGAIKLLFSKLVGRDIGEPEIVLWGSARDLIGAKANLRAKLANRLAHTTYLSVFRLTEDEMRSHIRTLNARRPKLVISYAAPLYELALLAEREGLEVRPQRAIITSASTLYPFMRETIERVFGCRIYDRYGSREVGDIACERPHSDGLWVAPWGNFIEVVDGNGRPVPDGETGDILVTSLTNYAMPLIRYKIEDRGVLSPATLSPSPGRELGQALRSVQGRSYDLFVNRDGRIIESGHFMPLLYFRDWIRQYQIVQKAPDRVVFRIVRTGGAPSTGELDELKAKTALIMGGPCEVDFEFVDDIVPPPSGKHRFIVSEVPR